MRLTPKILFLALFPLLIGGSAILIAGFGFHKQALLEESEERARVELEHHTAAIRDVFDEHVTSLTALATTRVLQEGHLPEILEQLRQWETAFNDIEALHFNDINGIVHDHFGKTFSSADRPFFPAIRRGETVITGVLVSRATGAPIVLIVVPILDASGRRTASMAGNINLSRLVEHVRQIKIGRTGFGVLVDETGNVVTGSHAGGETEDPVLVEVLKLASPSPIHFSLNGEACRIFCALGERYRAGNPSCNARQDLRSLFYDQGEG
jgi:methyl-accepting chemotaxis protein